jgi:hypothetical protein
MKNSTASLSHKIFLLLCAVIAILVVAPLVQAAYAWMNPTCTPPNCGGSLYRAQSGNVGLFTTVPSSSLTVNATTSFAGNLLRDVATPLIGTDGVNKDYVDTVAAAGGSGTTVTLFSISTSNLTPSGRVNTSQNQQGCYVGTSGLLCNGLPGTYGIAAGAGIGTCEANLGTGWQDLYSGYGPHGAIMSWFSNIGGGDPDEADYPSSIAAPTYSTCALVPDQYIPARYSVQSNGNVYLNISALSACVRNSNGQAACNTCKVCYKP